MSPLCNDVLFSVTDYISCLNGIPVLEQLHCAKAHIFQLFKCQGGVPCLNILWSNHSSQACLGTVWISLSKCSLIHLDEGDHFSLACSHLNQPQAGQTLAGFDLKVNKLKCIRDYRKKTKSRYQLGECYNENHTFLDRWHRKQKVSMFSLSTHN